MCVFFLEWASFVNLPSFLPAPLLDFGSPVPATQPSTDMWGDFTSAASKLVMRAHTCAVAPSAHVCRVWCSYLMTSLNLLRCSPLPPLPPLLLPAAPVKIPSNQDGCSSAESRNRLGHARVLTFQLSAAVLEVILLLQSKQHKGTKPIKCTYFTF